MTPAEIARSLTDAQRRAVLNAKPREERGVWHPAGVYLFADKRVRRNLAFANIVRDYLGEFQRLTPLGLQVRQILQEQPK